MNFKQSFIMALKSLQSSVMRSILTMLGIIIGVSSVIILVSIINGFSNDLKEQFESFGTNLVNVMITDTNALRKVSEEDIGAFVSENPELYAGYSPTVSASYQTVKFQNTNFTTTVNGVNDSYDTLRSMELTQGDFLSYLNVAGHMDVCVIGSYEKDKLFGTVIDPLGQVIKINGRQFTVIGVLAETSGSSQGSTDDVIYVPYTTAQILTSSNQISSYVLAVTDTLIMDDAVSRAQTMLSGRIGSTYSFSVYTTSTFVDQINTLQSTLTLVLVGIAAISLLVGGIGIMNIMIVSVTERTREIGIRMSVGAKGRDILSQFLIEAATTSAVGGIIGILFGIATCYPIGSLLGVAAAVSANSIIIAFCVSAGIGIIFGFVPARKAARMNPIDALRFE
jgi:putative ABC transport system permease protein